MNLSLALLIPRPPSKASANNCEYPANLSGLTPGRGPLRLAGCRSHRGISSGRDTITIPECNSPHRHPEPLLFPRWVTSTRFINTCQYMYSTTANWKSLYGRRPYGSGPREGLYQDARKTWPRQEIILDPYVKKASIFKDCGSDWQQYVEYKQHGE